jgi:alkylated DNA nucleotide flippase Atl1
VARQTVATHVFVGMPMSVRWSSTTLKDVELVRSAITPMLRVVHAEQELLKVRSPPVSNR